MTDAGAELPTPPPSVLDNPRMKQLVEDLGIEQEDLGTIEGLGRFSSERYAEFFHNRFNRVHEEDAIPLMERELASSEKRLSSMADDDYGRPRIQDWHDMIVLFLPFTRRYGRAASYRLETFMEMKDEVRQ